MISIFKRLAVYLFGICMSYGPLVASAKAQAETKEAPKRIAVLELKNMAPTLISRAELTFLSDEIRRITSLLPSTHYSVITKENIAVLLPPDTQLEDCVGSCEVETGKMLSADYVITGELIKFGKSLRVSLKAHETRSATFLKGESAKGVNIEDLETPIHRATLSLMYEISPSFQKALEAKAGVGLDKQLACLKDRGQCSHKINAKREKPLSPSSPTLQRKATNPRLKGSSMRASIESNHEVLGNLGTAGLYLFVTSYALTITGVILTDPYPGQVQKSFIPVLGPLEVQEINTSNGETDFEATNKALALIQGIGLGLMALDLILPSQVVKRSSTPISIGFWSNKHSKSAWISGQF